MMLLLKMAAWSLLAQSGLPHVWNERAIELQENGRFVEAREAYRNAIAEAETAAAAPATRLRLLLNLAALELETGDRHSAIQHVRSAKRLAEEVSPHTAEIAGLHGTVATLHLMEGKLSTAQVEYAKALEILQRIHAPADDIAGVMQNMASVLMRQGKYTEARKNLSKAVELTQGSQLVRALASLSTAEYLAKDPTAADQTITRAITLAEAHFGRDHWLVGDLRRNLDLIRNRKVPSPPRQVRKDMLIDFTELRTSGAKMMVYTK